MDAITLLKADHRAFKKLTREFAAAHKSTDPQRAAVVQKMTEALSVHMSIEEQIFYPAARREVPGIDDYILESVEEHHIVKWTLAELTEMDPADERYDAKVAVLVEVVQAHAKEEEDVWFPKVRQHLSRSRLADLGAELEAAKPRMPRTPQPETAASRK